MLTPEVLLFTGLLGALAPLALGCVFEFAFSRARWALESSVFLLSAGLFVFSNSVLLSAVLSGSSPLLNQFAPPLSACLSTALGVLGIRNWLGTRKREHAMDLALLMAVGACLAAALGVLVFEPMGSASPSWVAQVAYMICIAAMVILGAAAVRVAVHGDSGAWEMVTVVAFVGVLSGILFCHRAFGWQFELPVYTAGAVLYATGMMLMLRAAWRRGRHFVHVARMLDTDSGRDPITRLLMGAGMISSMDRIYNRTLRQRHRPVVIVVQLFNADEIVKECGENGLNQVLLATLARIRNTVAPADLVGRYYGACFAIQIAGRATPQYLRGLGLRLAGSTRRPVVPRLPPSGFEDDEPIETDVGVGICWIHQLDDFTLALHEAETAARAARELRSRAAVKLATDAEPIAVEKALGEAKLHSGFLDSATASVRRLPRRLAERASPMRLLKVGMGRARGGKAPGLKPSARGGTRGKSRSRSNSTMSTQVGY